FTSVETSPEYADRPRLDVLKRSGVARVSIGIQSFLDEELKALKRRPRQNTIYRALEEIRQMDFPCFNIDLIYGIKGQTVESFLYSLKEALRFRPSELFIYPLYVRRGTGITEREPDDVCFRMYRAACDLLQAEGFLQTSMRRFVRHRPTGAEVSCGDEVMLSCGSGGRSYLGDLHYATRYTVCQQCIAREIDDYVATTDFTVARNGFLLSAGEQRQRFIIKNLLYYMGLDKAEYLRRFGESVDRIPLFRQLAERQWTEETPERIRLTPEGLGYSDYIGQLFITPEIRQLMETYTY
ncbi:radical SAM protein, partial [uncultured Bacteroides sp.]